MSRRQGAAHFFQKCTTRAAGKVDNSWIRVGSDLDKQSIRLHNHCRGLLKTRNHPTKGRQQYGVYRTYIIQRVTVN